jgi:prefoldin subunit 1
VIRRHKNVLDEERVLMTVIRFVCTPIPDVQKRLQTESEALTKELSNLDKKEDYLEKTYTNSKNSLEQLLKGAS